ncbi:KGK domain-containing protein [Calothrix sp. PCC 7507]|uniref:KGK domain-containing protein n=1 Tax=Calothrix sp. PCC 7507 TaxID=99598 RepID=UPI00029F3006|nr:KGK domain-containing protein [Calothrix sp. PCC 7507]AFY34747.1 KGK family protein [Calothrix sp. PCC 7507]
MEDKFKPIECNDGDVIEFGNNTYKIDRFIKAVHQSCNASLGYQLHQELNKQRININSSSFNACFGESKGIDCQILKLGSKTWKKGKLRFQVSVEFYIEDDINTEKNQYSEITELESPLDDLRRIINEDKS